VQVTVRDDKPLPPARPDRVTFAQDFKQFFLRGLAALLPTLITLWLLVWAWNFLWDSLGKHLVDAIQWLWPESYLATHFQSDQFSTRLFGVGLSVVLVYIVGFFVGNLIGRTFWRVGETFVMKIPIVRAIYPAVKQVTDFVLVDRTQQFKSSRVVAIQPHEKGIWSIGLVTGEGLKPMDQATGQEMVMVFLPNSPAAFSGYVLVVPRSEVVELPLTVEEAMRLLVSGGVIVPGSELKIGGRAVTVQPKVASLPPVEGGQPPPGHHPSGVRT
jgi:uncharacterized membrane protein